MQHLKGRTRPGKAESIAVSVVSSSSRTIADCHERATRPRITVIGDSLIRIHNSTKIKNTPTSDGPAGGQFRA
ncbi:hypothetical protein BDFB_011680 [Asbolus verrucosus]|uniref:Uncharacterized protein n=1 Tax=Asbolus verrucosus TaxID=1661398 RepID=A0A482VGA7_ASBVE|nr:hypothetical protein BDFB_011680 [Asbolus verrucosus]